MADDKECDFCTTEANPQVAAWRFPCSPFTASSGAPNLFIDYRGDWAACDECRRLVALERWDELVDRCFNRAPEFWIRATQASVGLLSKALGTPMEVRPGEELEAARSFQRMVWTATWREFNRHRRGPAIRLTGDEIFPDPLPWKREGDDGS